MSSLVGHIEKKIKTLSLHNPSINYRLSIHRILSVQPSLKSNNRELGKFVDLCKNT